MEASNPIVPPVPIEIPIWKRSWFWLLALPVAGCLGLLTLGILATLVVPNVLHKFAFASRAKAKADILVIENAAEEYALANDGKYPDSLDLLVEPDVHGHTYLDTRQVPKDPWGRIYAYERPKGGRSKPRILSYGRDGKVGGEGDDADIDSDSLGATK